MMKENSPTCASVIPLCTARPSPFPVRKVLTDTAITLPTITTADSTSTAPQCCTTTLGSMSMPTDTKKIATNRSRTGCTSCSTAFSSPDSETSEPAMKAPSATE